MKFRNKGYCGLLGQVSMEFMLIFGILVAALAVASFVSLQQVSQINDARQYLLEGSSYLIELKNALKFTASYQTISMIYSNSPSVFC